MPPMLIFTILACQGGGGPSDAPSDTATTEPTGLTADTGATGSSGDTGSPTDPCRAGELLFTPAVGSYDVFPIIEGDALTVIQGPQGGYHVDFAGVVSKVPNVGIILRPLVTLDDGTVLAGEDDEIQSAFFRYDEATCTGEFSGTRMFVLWDAPTLCGFSGRQATLSLQLEDFDGRVTATTLGVEVAVDLLDPYDCATL